MQKSLWDTLNRTEKSQFRFRLVHGGETKGGRRKGPRPLVRKKWVHVVLKSTRAYGVWSMFHKRNKATVEGLIFKHAKSRHIEIKQLVNMGNHLHLKVRFFDRELMQNFLRVVPALIARKVMGAEKGQRRGRFWQGLVFTRVMSSSFEDLRLRHYFDANQIERDCSPEARRVYLSELNGWIRNLHRKSAGLPIPSGFG
jgi:hypothetical protein